MSLLKDPTSGLMLPREFIDQKVALKKVIDEVVENAINEMGNIQDNYFLTIHAKFDPAFNNEFRISEPKVTLKLPGFLSNTFCFWVNPRSGLCELLWMVPPKRPGEKLKVEFNTSGVAYLQAKGAMPS